jgi:hypothetical protein
MLEFIFKKYNPNNDTSITHIDFTLKGIHHIQQLHHFNPNIPSAYHSKKNFDYPAAKIGEMETPRL